MTNQVFFRDLELVVTDFLGLSHTQKVIKEYAWHLSTVCDLIKRTHLLVISKLSEVEDAQTLEKAKEAIKKLEGAPLTDTFRANHLCDVFVGFGIELRKLVDPLDSEQEKLKMPYEQELTWRQFSESLERREREVATLYADMLQDLITMAGTNGAELDAIKTAAKISKSRLTLQIANFDFLANEFRKLQMKV